MPFTVIDRNDETIGVIVGRYKEYYLVAATAKQYSIAELCPLDRLEQMTAVWLNSKDLFGRIKRDKHDEYLWEWWEKEKGFTSEAFEPQRAMAYMALDKGILNAFNLPQKVTADRYFLCQKKELTKEGNIRLNVNKSDLPEVADLPFPALICRIIAYPEIEIELPGIGATLLLGGGINDLGGYNHIHCTRLQIHSGDVVTDLDLPGVIFTQKGGILAVEMRQDKTGIDFKGSRIFTGGTIYLYSE